MHVRLAQVSVTQPEYFDAVAVELQRTDGWRYGYVTQRRDTRLVKTPEDLDSPAFTAPDPDDALAALMSRKLRSRVWKAWAEFGFYVVLGLYVQRAARWRRAWSQSPSRRAATASLAAAGFVALGLAPYVIAGYGEPLFQSLYSASNQSYTQQLVPVTGPIEPTISYTGFVQAVTAFGVMVPTFVGLRRSPGVLWFMSVMFWATAAWLVSDMRHQCRQWWHRRRLRTSRREG